MKKILILAFITASQTLLAWPNFGPKDCLNLEHFHQWTVQQGLTHQGMVTDIKGVEPFLQSAPPELLKMLGMMLVQLNREIIEPYKSVKQNRCKEINFTDNSGQSKFVIEQYSPTTEGSDSILEGTIYKTGLPSTHAVYRLNHDTLTLTSTVTMPAPQLGTNLSIVATEQWNYGETIRFQPSPAVWTIHQASQQ